MLASLALLRPVAAAGILALAAAASGTTDGRGSYAAPSAGTLRLRDSTWAQVTVEIRVGAAVNCNSLPVYASYTVERNSGVFVAAPGQRVCWRRDVDPDHPDGRRTAWHFRDLSESDVLDEALQ